MLAIGMLEVRILGPFEVRRDDAPVDVGGPKQRAVLAMLVLEAGRVVSTDRLVDGVWGERPPPSAIGTLQAYVSHLRRALGPGVIEGRSVGYELVPADVELDVDRFQRGWQAGRSLLGADPRAALHELDAALGLWRGDALVDFRYDEFARADAARLEEMRLGCVEDRIDAALALGEHGQVVGELEQLAAVQPTRERLAGQLMLALYRSGRQADALAAYRQIRERLLDELGIDPSPALAQLERGILNHDPSLQLSPSADVLPPTPIAGDVAAPRMLLVVAQDEELAWLAAFAARLVAFDDARELIVADLVTAAPDAPTRLAEATRRLATFRADAEAKGRSVRIAAFTTRDAAADAAKLAGREGVDLVLCDGRAVLRGEQARLGLQDALLADAPCDAGLVVAPDEGEMTLDGERGVVVPFGGQEHDWAALELGAFIARAEHCPLLLAGAQETISEGDASRLLAEASLLLQRAVGIHAEPHLVSRGADGVLDVAERHGLLIVGLPATWRKTGLGAVRYAMATEASCPAIFIRRGVRPGVLTPRDQLTQHRWSINTHHSSLAATAGHGR